MATQSSQFDTKLLEILRCPVAVHYTDKGDDPGKLELVRDFWLHSPDSGYKYPIIDGIPKMLIEEGAKWKDTDTDDLPVPPPNDPVYAAAEDALSPEAQEVASKLSADATTARTDAVNQLRSAAQEIRSTAQTEADGAASSKADEIAAELEGAADYLARGAVSTPPPPPAGGHGKPPWRRMALVLVAGLMMGMFLRGKRKDDDA